MSDVEPAVSHRNPARIHIEPFLMNYVRIHWKIKHQLYHQYSEVKRTKITYFSIQ